MRKQLQRNLQQVTQRVQLACDRAGRSRKGLRLLPVTKSVGVEVAAALFDLGCHELAENRLEGLRAKASAFAERELACRWHFIGQIQRNKAARILGLSDVIHSVDRQSLLESLLRHAESKGSPTEIYLQVKLDDGDAKTGFEAAMIEAAIRTLDGSPQLPLRGLMGMAPLAETPEEKLPVAKAAFESLSQLAQSLPSAAFVDGRVELSMGMSADLEAAVAAGSGVLRIGRALFEGVESDSGAKPHASPGAAGPADKGELP